MQPHRRLPLSPYARQVTSAAHRKCAILAMMLWFALTSAAMAAEPVRIPNADFSELTPEEHIAHWETRSQPPGLLWQSPVEGEGLRCPRLDRGQWLELLSAPLPVTPHHRYRLTIRWRGGLFYQWNVVVRYRLSGDGGRAFDYPLFPSREGLAPPPAWETQLLEFIVPSDATGARLALVVSGDSDRGYRPGLREVQLLDVGVEPFSEAIPRPHPSQDIPAALVGPHEGGRSHRRLEQPGRHLVDIAGTRVQGAGMVLANVWARGEGNLCLSARIVAPDKGRFFDFVSPAWELTDQWQTYRWELPILFPDIPNVDVGIVADVRAEGPVELAEPAARTVGSTSTTRP